MGYGNYINTNGSLVADRAFSDAVCPGGTDKDSFYRQQYTGLGLSPEDTGISSAMDYAWDVFVINGKIHVTDFYRPSTNSDEQAQWQKERAAMKTFLSSLPEVRKAFVLDSHGSGFLGAVFSDGSVGYIDSSRTVTKPDGWNVVSAFYYGTVANGGILGLKADGTLCFELIEGEVDADFSQLSSVAAIAPYSMLDYREEEEGFVICLLNDGTLLATTGKQKRVLANNVVKIDSQARVYLTSDNRCSAGGTVSDWHNVAYLKEFINSGTVVAAMKDGTVEVVSPGSASKDLLDFFASVKDLKVSLD